MFFEVLSPIYHSPITIELLTYRVLLRTLAYSSGAGMLTQQSNRSDSTSPTSPLIPLTSPWSLAFVKQSIGHSED
jgi:hypothetical protein